MKNGNARFRGCGVSWTVFMVACGVLLLAT